MEIRDYVFISILIVNLGALCATIFSISRQSKAIDAKNYFDIKKNLADAWRKYLISKESESQEKEEKFNFFEILSLLEGTCHLYNKRIFHGATKEQVRDYMNEVIPRICEDAKERLIGSMSSPKTYSEIRKFAKSQNIKEVEEAFRQAKNPPPTK